MHCKDIETLHNAGLEFDHPQITKDNAVIVFINDDEYSKLQSMDFRFEILIDDWYEHYKNFLIYLNLKKLILRKKVYVR